MCDYKPSQPQTQTQTQTQVILDFGQNQQVDDPEPDEFIWGRLLPIGSAFSPIGKIIKSQLVSFSVHKTLI